MLFVIEISRNLLINLKKLRFNAVGILCGPTLSLYFPLSTIDLTFHH